MKTRYRVKVNDKRREWSVSSNGDGKDGNDAYCYVPSPLLPPEDPTHVMGDEAKGQIAGRLADRDALRKKKEYQRADAILDELKERYSVVVDNAAKEWKVVLGNIEDDAFAMEAQLSRRSAFMRRGNTVEGTWAAAQKEEPRRKNDDTIKLVVKEDPGAELILRLRNASLKYTSIV